MGYVEKSMKRSRSCPAMGSIIQEEAGEAQNITVNFGVFCNGDAVEKDDASPEDQARDDKLHLRRSPRPGSTVGGGGELHQAVGENDVAAVSRLLWSLQRRLPQQMLNERDCTGSTPLFLCKTAECCRMLINAGAHVDIKNKDGLTALHKSALFGRLDVVCCLLQAGCDKYACDHKGRSPLDAVSDRLGKMERSGIAGPLLGKLKSVALLLDSGDSTSASMAVAEKKSCCCLQ